MLFVVVDLDKGIIFYKDFVLMMVVEDLQQKRYFKIMYCGFFFSFNFVNIVLLFDFKMLYVGFELFQVSNYYYRLYL